MAMFGSPHKYSGSSSWVKRHSLSLALVVVLVIQATIVGFTGWEQFIADAQAHKEPVQMVAFAIWFVYEMTVSIIADTYGALLLVLFAKWFYEEGSPESKE